MWAPERERVRLARRPGGARHDPRRPRLVARRGARHRRRHRLRVPARRRRDAAARPAFALAARRRARPVAALLARRVRLDRRRAGPAGSSPAAWSTSCTSARSPSRARSTPRSSGSTTSSSWVSTSWKCCRSTRSTAPRAGATTAWRGARCTSRTAGRTRSSGSSTPATRVASPCCSTWCTTTSARPARTSTGSGPYFAGRTIWGPALNLDGPLSDEVRRYVLDNALSWLRDYHLDGLRLDAVHALVDKGATHLLEELASEVDALSAGAAPAAVADRRVGPQRPQAGHLARRGRLRPARPSGATTSTTRCTWR